jgi:hypothetical protein
VKDDLCGFLDKAEEKMKGELASVRLSRVTEKAVAAYRKRKT